MVTERGQLHVLEGVMAALIVLIAILFAFQAIVLTPTTAGTVDRDVKAHLATEASDTLHVSNDRGWLRNVTLFWNTTARNGTGAFNESAGPAWTPTNGYGNAPLPGRFGSLFNRAIGQDRFFNIYVDYRSRANPSQTRRAVLVHQGTPTGNAVTASATLTLYDTDRVRWWKNGAFTVSPNAPQVGALEGGRFYAPDLPGPVYNVLVVKVVVW